MEEEYAERYHQESFLEWFGMEKDTPQPKRRKSKAQAAVALPSGAAKRAETLLMKICLCIGVPTHMHGYAMLREGVLMGVREPELVYNLSNGLYVMLAQKFHCSTYCIERDIRNVIAVTWERGLPEEAARLLGAGLRLKNGKPTNSELISLLVERLRMEAGEF